MPQKLLEWFRTLLFLVRDVEKNKSDVADLQREVKDLSDSSCVMRCDAVSTTNETSEKSLCYRWRTRCFVSRVHCPTPNAKKRK